MNGRDAAAPLDASLLLDGEDRILEGNRDAEVFLEKPLEEARKTPLAKANPALYSALKELLAKTRRGRGVEDYALAYKVGKRLMRLNINMSPYPLEALGATGTLVTISSVGMRPPAERRAVKEEEEAPPPPAPGKPPDLQQLMQVMAEPAFLLDMEANFTCANPVMCALLGHDEEELIGRPLSFFMLREDARQALESLVEAARAAPWRGDLEFNRGDGTACAIAVTIDALKPARGRAKLLLGTGRDITAEMRMRREREDELQRVWSLLERVGAALACFTPDLRVTLLSRSAEEMFSTTNDRAIGTPLPDLFAKQESSDVAALLERAVKGEELDGVVVRTGGGEGRQAVFMSVKPAVQANGMTREYMAVFSEATRELSQAEEVEALLEASRVKERILEMAVRSLDAGSFLAQYLEELRETLGCEAAAFFSVSRGEALLRAQYGLGEGEEEQLAVLRLRPGHARLCGMMDVITLEIHGGVPRKGWDEVHSLIEKADAHLPMLKDRRWRSIVVLPLRREGDAVGALVLAGCDPGKVEAVAGLAAAGDALASALAGLGSREARAGRAGEAGAETPPGREPTGSVDTITGEGPPRRSHHGSSEGAFGDAEQKPAPVHAGARGGPVPAPAPPAGKEHDYFEIARGVKGMESPPDNLALFAEQEAERFIPPTRGVDLSALFWDMKEYFGRGERRGEIFLEIEEDLPRLYTDKRMLREALIRLIDNACRFSPPSAPLILGAERWGDEVLLRVEDQGEGIAAEVVEEVMQWDPAEEAGEERGRKGYSGLFLCRRYVAAIGGELSIKGKKGEGTTAFIRLRVLPFIGESP